MSPPFDSVDIRDLERQAFRAWPALETHTSFGWIQRFAGGYTKRANSINALGEDIQFDANIRTALEQPYRERGLRPIWRLTPLAPPDVDGRLAALGYRRIDESLVQVAPLDTHAAPDPAITIAPAPSTNWLAGFAELSPVPPVHREAMARMLTSIPARAGFAQVEQGGRPVAFALGVVEDEHVGLFDVLVAPAARRQGLARRLTRAVGAWGSHHGARFSYLQVVAANESARALYAELGFETVYSYAYRVP